MPSYLDLGLDRRRADFGLARHGARLHPRGAGDRLLGRRRRSPRSISIRCVLPYVKDYLHHRKGRRRAGHVGRRAVFFVTLIVVSLITIKLSDAILDSKIGALDRSLGFVFGAARGLLPLRHRLHLLQLAGAGEDASPNGSSTAASTRPLLQATGDQLMAMLPDDPEGILAKLKTAESRGARRGGAPPDSDVEPKAAPPAAAPPSPRPETRREVRAAADARLTSKDRDMPDGCDN